MSIEIGENLKTILNHLCVVCVICLYVYYNLKKREKHGIKINVYNRRTALHHRNILLCIANICDGVYGSCFEEIY